MDTLSLLGVLLGKPITEDRALKVVRHLESPQSLMELTTAIEADAPVVAVTWLAAVSSERFQRALAVRFP